MAPTPVVHDLEALDAESLGNLGCADQLVDINAATHARILPHSAYMLTHPPSRESALVFAAARRSDRGSPELGSGAFAAARLGLRMKSMPGMWA